MNGFEINRPFSTHQLPIPRHRPGTSFVSRAPIFCFAFNNKPSFDRYTVDIRQLGNVMLRGETAQLPKRVLPICDTGPEGFKMPFVVFQVNCQRCRQVINRRRLRPGSEFLL